MTAAPTFGAWLLNQHGRNDAIGRLAKIAEADADLPVAGSFELVFGWGYEAGLRDDLLERALPATAAEHAREARR